MGNFNKVERLKSKLRLALTGVSGGGKTLGALLIAFGMTGDWSKVALIDTEHERARLYANRTDLGTGGFLYCPMLPPYSTEKYKALVSEAAGIVGPDGVVIVDSLTHAWNNEGGILDVKDKISARQGMNSYTAWNEAGKMQNSLVNTILAVDCHTIVTMRSKMDYVLQTNDRGKQVPVKIGLAPVQREDTEYEFDIVLDITRDHIATASKDVTFLDTYGDVITVKLGEELRKWLADGVEPSKAKAPAPASTKEKAPTQSKQASQPVTSSVSKPIQSSVPVQNIPTPEEAAEAKIDSVKLAVLGNELARTGIKESLILNAYGIKKFEDMTIIDFMDAMNKFKVTPDKKEATA